MRIKNSIELMDELSKSIARSQKPRSFFIPKETVKIIKRQLTGEMYKVTTCGDTIDISKLD